MATNNIPPWIHCNRCYVNRLLDLRRLALLTCYHVMCDECLKVTWNTDHKCAVCKKQCKFLQLNKLSSKYKRYFHPRPWEDLSMLKDVIPFQLGQIRRLKGWILKADQYMNETAEYNNQLKEKMKTMQRILSELKRKKENFRKTLYMP